MAEMMAGLNLVLLGKTGAGKSSAGNTILGQEAFVSRKSSRSVTRDVAGKSGTVCGFPVTVYDTTGFCHRELREEEVQLRCEEVLQRCESGPSVFLLVIKVDRFTEEVREAVEKIEKLLGEERLKKTWILFTGGDQLEDENMTIQEFINDNQLLKRLVQKYDRRYHVFNNMKKLTEQVRMLLTEILKTGLHTMGTVKRPTRPELNATLADSLSPRRIALLGRGGVGKSAAGNTILGQKEFRSNRFRGEKEEQGLRGERRRKIEEEVENTRERLRPREEETSSGFKRLLMRHRVLVAFGATAAVGAGAAVGAVSASVAVAVGAAVGTVSAAVSAAGGAVAAVGAAVGAAFGAFFAFGAAFGAAVGVAAAGRGKKKTGEKITGA